MLNSLFQTYTAGKLPVDLNNPNITRMLMLLVPELNQYYGKDVILDIIAEVSSNDEDAIHIDASKGMIIGDHDSVKFNLQVFASNATTTHVLAAEFENFFQIIANFTS